MIDKSKFCEYIREYEKMMYSLAFSITGNEADSGDVLSEAILRAYKNLGSLKKENSFKPWILKIVHNVSVEYIRKNAKLITMAEIPDTVVVSSESEITTKLTMQTAVASLKQPYRTVVILFYYNNLSIEEIAQITGARSAAIKKQLSRGREMLRCILKEDLIHE